MTEGYWLTPSYKLIPVIDHLMEVESSPKKFGVSKREVIGTRDLVLTRVMKNGWVRIRSHKNHTSIEGYGRDEDLIVAALVWAKKVKAWKNDNILINNLKTESQWVGTVDKLVSKLKMNPIKKIKFTRVRYRNVMRYGVKRMKIK